MRVYPKTQIFIPQSTIVLGIWNNNFHKMCLMIIRKIKFWYEILKSEKNR